MRRYSKCFCAEIVTLFCHHILFSGRVSSGYAAGTVKGILKDRRWAVVWLYEETLTRFPWVILISKTIAIVPELIDPLVDWRMHNWNELLPPPPPSHCLYHHHHNRGGLSGSVLVRVTCTSALWQQTWLCAHHTRWSEWHGGPSGAFRDSPGQEAVQGQHSSHYWWHQGQQCCSLQLSVSWMIQSSGFRQKHWSLCSGQYKVVWYGSLPSSG